MICDKFLIDVWDQQTETETEKKTAGVNNKENNNNCNEQHKTIK